MSHCTHWTEDGERCCHCNRVFPHAEWPPGYDVPCTPENVEEPTCDCACHRLGSEMIAADCKCRRTPENVDSPGGQQ